MHWLNFVCMVLTTFGLTHVSTNAESVAHPQSSPWLNDLASENLVVPPEDSANASEAPITKQQGMALLGAFVNFLDKKCPGLSSAYSPTMSYLLPLLAQVPPPNNENQQYNRLMNSISLCTAISDHALLERAEPISTPNPTEATPTIIVPVIFVDNVSEPFNNFKDQEKVEEKPGVLGKVYHFFSKAFSKIKTLFTRTFGHSNADEVVQNNQEHPNKIRRRVRRGFNFGSLLRIFGKVDRTSAKDKIKEVLHEVFRIYGHACTDSVGNVKGFEVAAQAVMQEMETQPGFIVSQVDSVFDDKFMEALTNCYRIKFV